MSVEQIEESLLKLNSEERRNFAEWFFEHEVEFLGEDDIHPEVQAMILARRREAEEHPERLVDWKEGMELARKRCDELRDKAS